MISFPSLNMTRPALVTGICCLCVFGGAAVLFNSSSTFETPSPNNQLAVQVVTPRFAIWRDTQVQIVNKSSHQVDEIPGIRWQKGFEDSRVLDQILWHPDGMRFILVSHWASTGMMSLKSFQVHLTPLHVRDIPCEAWINSTFKYHMGIRESREQTRQTLQMIKTTEYASLVRTIE